MEKPTNWVVIAVFLAVGHFLIYVLWLLSPGKHRVFGLHLFILVLETLLIIFCLNCCFIFRLRYLFGFHVFKIPGLFSRITGPMYTLKFKSYA